MKQSSEEPARLLGRLADNIDGILDAEMSSALHNLVESDAKVAGDFSDRDIPLLLGRMFTEGLTGRLCLGNGKGEKSVYFETGLPVMAASADSSDRMLAMLMRENVIDARQYKETERMVDATGRKVGAVLVDLGFLRSDELLPAVRRHYESIILTLFSWSAGHWHIEPNVTAGPERTRLLRHPAALVREGLECGYPAERIAARLGAAKNVFLLDNSTSTADITEQVTWIVPRVGFRCCSTVFARSTKLLELRTWRRLWFCALRLRCSASVPFIQSRRVRRFAWAPVPACATSASTESAYKRAMRSHWRATTSKCWASTAPPTEVKCVARTLV